MMKRTPQTQNTHYFRQAAQAAGAIVPEAQPSALPPVMSYSDGSLGRNGTGFLMTERHLSGVGDPLENISKIPGKGPVPINGIGKILLGSPILNAAKAFKGLGDSDTAVPTSPSMTFETVEEESITDQMARNMGGGAGMGLIAGLVLLQLTVAGVFSYQIGKAIAPTQAKQKKYALWAVPVGLFSPYLGLGVMSIYALNQKK